MAKKKFGREIINALEEIKACGDLPRISFEKKVFVQLEDNGLIEIFDRPNRRSRGVRGGKLQTSKHLRLSPAGAAFLNEIRATA